MSKLTAIKKQIAALEAQAERIAKGEMSSAIAKVKGIMAEFNLTIEHLAHSVTGKLAAKKTKTKAKTASVAKYADPKTGKTWSGFGRAPGWIAGVKDRDAFLVGKATASNSAAKGTATAKKTAAKAVKTVKVAKKAAKPAVKKVVASAKKVSGAKDTSATAKKKPAAKKSTVKKTATKRAAAASPAESSAAPAA